MAHPLTPSLVIALAASILGLSWNALRPRDGIEIGRTYFAAAAAAPGPADGSPNPTKPASGLAVAAAAEFTLVSADEVLELVAANGADPCIAVLLDARSRDRFAAGHVPGALPLDFFNVRTDIAPSLPFLRYLSWRPMPLSAEPPPGADFPLLVVYCESDECEDGFQLCRMLRDEYGITTERIRLYLGGMRDWQQRRLPTARGGLPW
jgi:rhodanese-related sulfurtransferase